MTLIPPELYTAAVYSQMSAVHVEIIPLNLVSTALYLNLRTTGLKSVPSVSTAELADLHLRLF